MSNLVYDDTNLRELYKQMQPDVRIKSLRGAMRKGANGIRKAAIANLRASGLRTDKDVEKGIYNFVAKRKAVYGAKISPIKSTKNRHWSKGMHINRQGKEKPVLLWAELGTVDRRTNGKGLFRKKRRSTGKMPAYGFMDKTLNEVKDTAADDMVEAIVTSVNKVAKKYGCE